MTAASDLQHDLPSLLTIHDIASLLRLHRTAAYARTRDPDFPDPLVISGSCYRWYTHEVLTYIDARRTPKRAPRPRQPSADPSVVELAVRAVPRPRTPRRATTHAPSAGSRST